MARDIAVKVAYLLHRFPYQTETFIVREMYWLRQMGFELTIFSLLKERSTIMSDQLESLLDRRRHYKWWSFQTWVSHLYFLRRRPLAYFRSLGKLILLTYREPLVLARSLAIFPTSVAIAHQVELERIEHIHAHFVWLEGLAAVVVRELVGTSFSLHPHAFDLYSRDQRDVAKQLEQANGIITISNYNREHIQGLSPVLSSRMIEVVHCGVDPGTFSPADSPEGEIHILSVGRAVEKKGHEYLIGACAQLRSEGRIFRCSIVTGGLEHSAHLTELIKRLGLSDAVAVLGARGEKALIDLYRSSHIFALASVVAHDGDRDGIPVSLMEAMACSVPVVSTNVSGIGELISHGNSGLLVEPRDVAGLAAALKRLIDDPSLRSQLAERGRRVVETSFDARVSAERMAALFEAMRSASSIVKR